MIASSSPAPVANPESVPSVATNRTCDRLRQQAVSTLATADTANSNDSGVWTRRRTSSMTVARPCHGSSSRRIIRSS